MGPREQAMDAAPGQPEAEDTATCSDNRRCVGATHGRCACIVRFESARPTRRHHHHHHRKIACTIDVAIFVCSVSPPPCSLRQLLCVVWGVGGRFLTCCVSSAFAPFAALGKVQWIKLQRGAQPRDGADLCVRPRCPCRHRRNQPHALALCSEAPPPLSSPSLSSTSPPPTRFTTLLAFIYRHAMNMRQ